jgi:hypothetical protein
MAIFRRKRPEEAPVTMPPAMPPESASRLGTVAVEGRRTERRRRDPLAWMIGFLAFAAAAWVALNWSLIQIGADSSNTFVHGVARGAGYLLAPWRNLMDTESLGVISWAAGGAYFVAGMLVLFVEHAAWRRMFAMRRPVRTA